MTSPATPNFFTNIRKDKEVPEEVFQAGDCGIILKPDGNYRIISTGIDAEALKADPATMDEATLATYQMGQRLMGLAIACASPQIMNILLELAADPNILDPQLLAQIANPH